MLPHFQSLLEQAATTGVLSHHFLLDRVAQSTRLVVSLLRVAYLAHIDGILWQGEDPLANRRLYIAGPQSRILQRNHRISQDALTASLVLYVFLFLSDHLLDISSNVDWPVPTVKNRRVCDRLLLNSTVSLHDRVGNAHRLRPMLVVLLLWIMRIFILKTVSKICLRSLPSLLPERI